MKTMKLKVNEIKKFKGVAGALRQNNILPILSYLKFENGLITKNNLESFVTMEADFEGAVLIDEKILMSFIEYVNGSEIDVNVSGNSVVLSCGKEKYKSPTDDVINFPKVEEGDAQAIEFDSDLMDEIRIASNFTEVNPIKPYAECVFIGKGIIAASEGYISYTKKLEKEYPEIILEKNVVNCIKGLDNVFFYESGNHQFFQSGIYKFGFLKKDTNFTNMTLFSKLPEGLDKFEIDKSELVAFCNICINSCQGRFVSAKIEGAKAKMIDSDYENDYEKDLSVSLPEFTFNPAQFNVVLKALPDEKISVLKEKNKYYITGDGGYVSLIMEIQIK